MSQATAKNLMSDLDQAGKNYLRLKDRVKKMQAELDDIREFFVETIGSGASTRIRLTVEKK